MDAGDAPAEVGEGLEREATMDEDEELDYSSYYARLDIAQPSVRNLCQSTAEFLENLIAANADHESAETLFDMANPPRINLPDFLKRVEDYSLNSPESWILALIIIEKYIGQKAGVVIHRQNIYK